VSSCGARSSPPRAIAWYSSAAPTPCRSGRWPPTSARPDLLAYGLLAGLLAGFITDAAVTAAGV